MGNVTQKDEPIWYYEYNAELNDTARYSGIIRVVLELNRNGTEHLTIDDPEAPAGKRNINSVQNEEQWDSWIDLNGQSYWERADEGWVP